MIVACHQPNYIPWIGYFYKLKLADTFVILDFVQFPRGTSWVNRNRIKTPYGQLWLTVPVKRKGLGLQQILEVQIDNTGDWKKKHFLSLAHFYKKAPYFYDYIEYFEKLYNKKWVKLLNLNLELIKEIVKWLEIKTKIVKSSELFVGAGLKHAPTGSELLIQICESIGADTYLSGTGGRKYIEIQKFKDKRINVKSFSFNPTAYPQLWGKFISNLSIIDLLFNCGKKGFDLQTKSVYPIKNLEG